MSLSRRSLWRNLISGLLDIGDDASAGSAAFGVSITAQPANWLDDEGADAIFTVAALSGNASTLFYQWQERVLGIWTNLTNTGRFSGVTTATMTLADTVVADSGRHFRVIVTNSVNSKYSTSPTVTVNDLIDSEFSVLDDGGLTVMTPRTVLNAAGTPILVSGSVLNGIGTPIVVI